MYPAPSSPHRPRGRRVVEARNLDRPRTTGPRTRVVRFNKNKRTITFECWPRNVDVTNPLTKQYPGWPKTIRQQENDGRKAVAWLPEIKVSGISNPVVQIVDESNGEVVSTIRINGTTYRPKVFRNGTYTIRLGDQQWLKTLTGIQSLSSNDRQELKVEL